MAKKKFDISDRLANSTIIIQTPIQVSENEDLLHKILTGESSTEKNDLLSQNEDPEIRATFIIRQSIQHKVKMICAMEHRQIKDVADEIFSQYIENWEKKNGAIPNL